MRKQYPKPRLRLTLRFVYIVPVVSLLLIGSLILYFNLNAPQKAVAGTETIVTGSYVINMGVTPQTANNGLRPYGMVYDLMVNYNVPIKWVISTTKVKDDIDFTHNGVNYKGGTFIVPKANITTAVSTRITYWSGQGVQGNYTVADISVPVYATITNWPKLIIDDVSGNDNIITNYFSNASIPSAAYSIGTPSLLTYCHDMWANPHGDPTWATHGYLYNLVTVAKSYIWMQCHAVSVTEGVKNASSPFEQLNFLSTTGLKCYSGGKCGAIAETHSGNPSSPFTHLFPTDPVMQFMGTMDGATDGGSEKWYQPVSTGAWRATSKRCVTTSDGTSPNEGTVLVYGPAYGDTNNGLVMYEGGHNLAGNGSAAERVAGQRVFFNFLLLAGIAKQIVFNTQTSPASLMGNESGTCSVTVSAGSPGYTYAWTSTVGGSFANSTAATTTFTAPVVGTVTTGNLICTVTDACGRKNFVSRPLTISTSVLPIELKELTAKIDKATVRLEWITASELNNDFFTIYRSPDGINYTEIAILRGSGNSTSDIAYSYVDDAPEKSYNYYKLKQTDFDGKSETFGPVYVKRVGTNRETEIASIGPNPFTDYVSIDYYSEKPGPVQFTIMNQTGAIIRTQESSSREGMNIFEFNDLSGLPTGIYYAVLANQQAKKVVKILKN